MAPFLSVSSVLAVLTLFLHFSNIIYVEAVRDPNEPLIEAPAKPKLKVYQYAIFHRTVRDAIPIAKHTALYWPCDATTDARFLRYFKPDDADLVKNIFRAIANIPFDLDLSDPAQLQTLTQTQLAYSPKFSDLPIYFLGDNPGLALPDGPGFSPDGKCSDNVGTQAYITPTYGGRHGLVSVCKDTYKLQPMLADILAPPAWAIDWSKGLSNGPQYFPGFGCKNLGSFDSLYLQSTGAILLHEMFHYKFLPGPGGRVTEHIITDFKGPILKNGYGPYNAEQINQLQPVDKDKLHWKGIYNADNDVWYALSSYYSRDCNIDFQRAPDEDSANTEPSRDLNPQALMAHGTVQGSMSWNRPLVA